MKKLSIVWLPMSPEVGFVAALGATETIHLPLFLFGDDLIAFKEGRGAKFTAETLLYGILYGLSGNHPAITLKSKRHFVKALTLIMPTLSMPSVERMILVAGANIRSELGSSISQRIMKNGLCFVPDSSMIRSDYISDLWVAAEERNEPDYKAVLQEIVEALKMVNYSDLLPEPRKGLCYIAAIAFSEVEPENMKAFMGEHFGPEDYQWTEKDKSQIAEYENTKCFSWKGLSAR